MESREGAGSSPPPIRVLVAEDEHPLHAALCDLVGAEPGLELAGSAMDADDAIEKARVLRPDVALVDVRMPGGGGPRAVGAIGEVSPGTRAVALSAYEDRTHIIEMLRAGAIGYLVKGDPPGEILDAIRRAARGQSSFSASVVAEVVSGLARDGMDRGDGAEALRRRESRFRLLLESAPDAIAIVDAEGRIVIVNAQTEQLFGYKRDELLGQPVELLVPERFRERHLGHRSAYLSGPKTRPMSLDLELTGRRKDGTEFPVEISLSGIEAEEGTLAAAFVRDVTEQRARIARDRDVAARRAVLSHLVSAEEEERRRIAADIHDDSIQVMTAAGMRLQILRRELTDAAQLERLSELERTVQLAIARLRHLLFALHPPALDNEGVSAALRMHLDEAATRSATAYRLVDRLGVQPPEATRVTVYRIARELLVNVEKHAEARNATVTLSEVDAGYLVSIADDGIGFVEELDPVPGHLGLEAVRQRTELAGGWLRIDSTPGQGTTIDFWIPALRNLEPAATRPR